MVLVGSIDKLNINLPLYTILSFIIEMTIAPVAVLYKEEASIIQNSPMQEEKRSLYPNVEPPIEMVQSKTQKEWNNPLSALHRATDGVLAYVLGDVCWRQDRQTPYTAAELPVQTKQLD